MSRPLKFRAWDFQRKVMYWWAIPEKEGGHTTTDQFLGGDVAIMQFTGLHDRRGKEIYEGDVVKPPYKLFDEYRFTKGKSPRMKKEGRHQFIVRFHCAAFEPFVGTFPDPAKWEILGNIYEQPDLLKQGDA